MRRFLTVTLAAAATLCSAAAPAYAAQAGGHPSPDGHAVRGTVSVSGEVTTPATYSPADLAALPQVTLPDTRSDRSKHGSSVTGVSVFDLVQAAVPVLPVGAKNGGLHVTVTVVGRFGSRAVALGELDPGFGNHPALLVPGTRPGRGYSDLEIPGDRGYARLVLDVRSILVAVLTPATPTPPAGGVEVTDGRHTTTLSQSSIAALPASTTTVTFLAGTTPQTHTETGPTLAEVLHAAHVPSTPTTAVAAIGSDGYVATVTPAEATSGRRPLLLSTSEDGVALTQPRLVAVGDVKGGRDVSGVVGLSVSNSGR